MNREDIIETPIWALYEKGQDYHRRTGIYTDTDRNWRFFNGNQWEGAKLDGVEPIQNNFIWSIVKYKLAVIHDNLYTINYSSQNYESASFRPMAERYCKMLNGYAARTWERDKLDAKLRKVTMESAVNSEGIIYVDFDQEKMYPINEVIDKSDVYYGNENDDDIQAQPYILIRKRMPVVNATELALRFGMSESKKDLIVGDNETFEEAGEAAKQEVDDMVTILYKLYKKDGTVHFSVATRYCEISEEIDTGLSLYPVAHFCWEECKGSARGEGEVKRLIPNQIEVNRILMRQALTVRYQAFPQKVVDVSKIANPQALNTVGGTIRTNGAPVDDIHKIVGYLPPAQMSPDVVQLHENLIQKSRELAGAGETATGQVNPEDASGRAILAVEQTARAPITAQKDGLKNHIEDLARIWLEYLIVYAVDGVQLEEEVTNEQTGKKTIQLVHVPQSALRQLQAAVKIDVSPKGPYDKFALERTLENLFVNGMFSIERLPELKVYVNALPDDSVAPKQVLLKVIEDMEKEQRKIAMIQAQAQMEQMRGQQFLMEDPDAQAEQIADARLQLEAQMAAEEERYAEQEAELDEETAEAEEATDE